MASNQTIANSRRSHSISYKLDVLKTLESLDGNLSATARRYNDKVTRQQIARWRAQKDELLRTSRADNGIATGVATMGPDFMLRMRKMRAEFPELEAELVDFINENHTKGVSLHKSKIQDEAIVRFSKLYPDRPSSTFKASHGWMERFFQRNNLIIQPQDTNTVKLEGKNVFPEAEEPKARNNLIIQPQGTNTVKLEEENVFPEAEVPKTSVLCFIRGCDHRSGREDCPFFRIPKSKLQAWGQLCRADRKLSHDADRICGCHFLDGQEEGDPIIFPCIPEDQDQHKAKKRKKKYADPALENLEVEVTDQVVPIPNLRQVYIDHAYPAHFHECAAQIQELDDKRKALEKRLEALQAAAARQPKSMSIHDIKDREHIMILYTNLPYKTFQTLLSLLQEVDFSYQNSKRSCLPLMTLEDQLLICLMKLKLNLLDEDIAHRFCTTGQVISNVVLSLIHALHECLYGAIIGKSTESRAEDEESDQKSFDAQSSPRAILDIIKVSIQTQEKNIGIFSQSKKSCSSMKGITCLAADGTVTHASVLYPDSTPDVTVIDCSGVMSKFKSGDVILVDDDFPIRYENLPSGVKMITLSCLAANKRQTLTGFTQAWTKGQKTNQMIKDYEILFRIPSAYNEIATIIFQVCCCLVDLRIQNSTSI